MKSIEVMDAASIKGGDVLALGDESAGTALAVASGGDEDNSSWAKRRSLLRFAKSASARALLADVRAMDARSMATCRPCGQSARGHEGCVRHESRWAR